MPHVDDPPVTHWPTCWRVGGHGGCTLWVAERYEEALRWIATRDDDAGERARKALTR